MKRWHPTLFVRFVMALHGLAAIALLLAPARWPLLLGGLFLLHALLAAIGLWPRSRLLGANLTRLPPPAIARRYVAITIDDGPDPEITPRVLALLARAQARATFFCIGERARQHPELCRQILAAGHAVENHGMRHLNRTSLYGPAGWRREVLQGQTTLQTITGHPPCFYRPVAGLRNPWLDPLLQAHGLRLACWTRRGYDTRESNPDIVLARLTRRLEAGDILLLHDGHAARTTAGEAVIIEVLPRLLSEIAARGLVPVTLAQAVTCP
jgi:peptidoglycan-N-acetylglucosamine deacetylase